MKHLNTQETETILRSYLFSGITPEELSSLLPCLNAEKRSYSKDEFIFRCGDKSSRIGLVLTGSANIVRDDFWGNRHIVTAVLPGESFGESYAATPQIALSISVQASSDTDILLLDLASILHICSSACVFHTRLIDNLVTLLASHNLLLNEKLAHITQHTLRDKILSYLSAQSLRCHSSYFDIPFDRQGLADYLNVDRSAMSSELSKMKKDGILDYQKNHFKLCVPSATSMHKGM